MSPGSLWRCALAALAAAVVVVGCAQIQASAVPPATPAPLLGPAPPVLVGADEVALLRSGPATFARLESLIDAARVSVHVEIYEFGRRGLADALIAAKRRGVSVTVIDDPSELSSVATAALLRAAGIDVVDYPVRKMMIDHVKLLVVDAAVAVVGGINWGVSSPANHDYDAEVRGPVVHNLDRVFARDLVTCGRNVRVPDRVADASIDVAATLPGAEIRPLAMGLIERPLLRGAAQRRHPDPVVSQSRRAAPRQGDRRRRDLDPLRERQLVRRRLRAQPRTRYRPDLGAGRRRRDARPDEP